MAVTRTLDPRTFYPDRIRLGAGLRSPNARFLRQRCTGVAICNVFIYNYNNYMIIGSVQFNDF